MKDVLSNTKPLIIIPSLLLITTVLLIWSSLRYAGHYSEIQQEGWIGFNDPTASYYMPSTDDRLSLDFEECIGEGPNYNTFTKWLAIDNQTGSNQHFVITVNYPWYKGVCFEENGEIELYTSNSDTGRDQSHIMPTYALSIGAGEFKEIAIGAYGYGRVNAKVTVTGIESYIYQERRLLTVYSLLTSIGIFSLSLFLILSILLRIEFLGWYVAHGVMTLIAISLVDGTFRSMTGLSPPHSMTLLCASLLIIFQITFTFKFIQPWYNRYLASGGLALFMGLLAVVLVLQISKNAIMLEVAVGIIIYTSFWCSLLAFASAKLHSYNGIILGVLWLYKAALGVVILCWQLGGIEDITDMFIILKTCWPIEAVAISFMLFILYRKHLQLLIEQSQTVSKEVGSLETDSIYRQTMERLTVHKSSLNKLLPMLDICESLPPKEEADLKRIIRYLGAFNGVMDSMALMVHQEAKESSCNMNRFVGELQANTKNLFETKKLFFKINMDDTVPTSLTFQKEIYTRILLNFIDNGAKYTQEGGVTVSISFRSVNDEFGVLDISFKDTGEGISEEAIVKLGGLFDQGEHSGLGTGTGVGLHITYKLIELVAGTFSEPVSDIGKGSTFNISLPARVTDMKNISPSVNTKVSELFTRFINLQLQETKVLIVCDDYSYGAVLEELFNQINARVKVVSNARDFYSSVGINQQRLFPVGDYYNDDITATYDFVFCAVSNLELAEDITHASKHLIDRGRQSYHLILQTAFCGNLDISNLGPKVIMVHEPLQSKAVLSALETFSKFNYQSA